MSRGSWTWRREFAHVATLAAALACALLLSGFDRAWWLRSLLAPALNVAGWACAAVAVLFAWAGEYPSAGAAAVVAALLWLGCLLVRPAGGGVW